MPSEQPGKQLEVEGPGGLKLQVGQCTRTGNFRETNENAINVKPIPNMIICLVADGMGGQAGGEVASKRAVEVIPRELAEHLKAGALVEDAKQIIRKAIVHANEDMIRLSAMDDNLKNMGTTVVLAVWQKGSASLFVTGVGDSRGYLVRNKKIEQLTVDHSLAQALVEAKTITAEEAKAHRFRNVLWKYLGSREVGEGPDVKQLSVQSGDQILLCTNGLHGVMPDERIRDCMSQYTDAQKCADALCQLALDSGSRSNVSCIVIDVVDKK
jgi:protein phosphatase